MQVTCGHVWMQGARSFVEVPLRAFVEGMLTCSAACCLWRESHLI